MFMFMPADFPVSFFHEPTTLLALNQMCGFIWFWAAYQVFFGLRSGCGMEDHFLGAIKFVVPNSEWLANSGRYLWRVAQPAHFVLANQLANDWTLLLQHYVKEVQSL